jgi:hypothetical protein
MKFLFLKKNNTLIQQTKLIMNKKDGKFTNKLRNGKKYILMKDNILQKV